MKLAASIGIPVSEFWEMTPYELNIYAEAYFEKQKNEFKEKITLEYWNAMWTIQWLGKKSQHPKPLKEILDTIDKPKKIMSDEDMLKQVMVLNKLFGGEVKLVKPKKKVANPGAKNGMARKAVIIYKNQKYEFDYAQEGIDYFKNKGEHITRYWFYNGVTEKYKDKFQFVGYIEDYEEYIKALAK